MGNRRGAVGGGGAREDYQREKMRIFLQPGLRNLIMVIFMLLMLMEKQGKDSSPHVRKEDDGGESNCSNVASTDWPGTGLGPSD